MCALLPRTYEECKEEVLRGLHHQVDRAAPPGAQEARAQHLHLQCMRTMFYVLALSVVSI